VNWKYTQKKAEELKPQKKNPRKISKEKRKSLERSLKKFGLADTIVINQDGTIIGGHQRYYLLRGKGKGLVDCMESDRMLTQEEVDELTIRLNKNTGDFDMDLLANGYDEADLLDWGFTGPVLRASGVPFDVRKAEPYYHYETYDFDIPVGENGENRENPVARIRRNTKTDRHRVHRLRGIPS